jgi:hypothetical protein
MDNFLAGNGFLHLPVEANMPRGCPALFALWKSFRNDADQYSDEPPKLIGFKSE